VKNTKTGLLFPRSCFFRQSGHYLRLSCFLLLLLVSVSEAQILQTFSLVENNITESTVCPGETGLIVISSKHLPDIIGHNIEHLSFLRLAQKQRQPVVFQIDQRDQQGRYIISPKDQNSAETDSSKRVKILGKNDELVFRKVDLGERLKLSSEWVSQNSLLEIEVISARNNPSRWIYILLEDKFSGDSLSEASIFYDKELDVVSSSVYKIGFSKTVPFLVDSLHWKLSEQSGWSPDISDMMKIRHQGKFFGIPFKRSQDDYHSRITGIKKGPLRIIRRTENRVRVFWKLKTPSLSIDYVMMPNGFVMDTLIDIPFKISLFFSDLETLTTMDWNNSSELPALSMHSSHPNASSLDLSVNGRQSADKKAFNDIIDTKFSLSSDSGKFNVFLDIPDDFPIKSNLYLMDDLSEIDLPENIPGQFGNIGFKTTNWENIDSKSHHLKFTVCVQRK